ncbi:hypothetical protein O181_112394 [Austropuccinia psidii MF-1]|uniref:Uncharacterized protein n=1 Tax=Austropuccinia psidii MF-1 TaxID=1389203 RepID=A0A9Q3K3W2_9BASI|nr:hypothetical protein [Austropuccinia psidii MF-1]
MNSYLHIKRFLGQKKTIELLGGCSPFSCKDKVKKIKNILNKQSLLPIDQKEELEMIPALKEGPVASTSSRNIQREAQRTSEEKQRSQEPSEQGQRQSKKRIGKPWTRVPMESKNSREDKRPDRPVLNCHKCRSTSHLANTFTKKTD